MEQGSGAHIVYRSEPFGQCCIYGTEEARVRAWQLVQEKLWDLEHACEEQFNLDRKYHGTLIGKESATVQALQSETGARVRFESKAGPGQEVCACVYSNVWKRARVCVCALEGGLFVCSCV